MDSRLLYTGLIALVACERGVEMLLSRRNRDRALAAGGIERGQGHYAWMVLVHGTFLIACLLEVWLLDRPFRWLLGLPMGIVAALAMALRYWAVTTLAWRWNTRVIVIPGRQPVASGPYRYLRHPNYLAVVVEIVALPLVHGAWLTATVYTVLNAVVLRTRIRVEEAALAAAAGADPG